MTDPSDLHHLTMTVEVRLDLTVPTGVGPDQVAATIASTVERRLENAPDVSHREPIVVTVGAWHLTADGGRTFTGKLG